MIQRYLKNLLIAMMGRDPFKMELERVKLEYEQTAKKVQLLEKLHYQVDESSQQLAKAKEEIQGCQKLIENLRQSVVDKDTAIEALTKERRERLAQVLKDCTAKVEELKVSHARELREQQERYERDRVDRHEEYEEKMAERDAKIAGLREDLDRTLALLQKANQAVGREMMAQVMLDKTNNGMADLLTAMQSGEVEKIVMATQYLDWSNPLSCIAQQHLMVLRRKNELVKRLHFVDVDDADSGELHE